MKNIVSFNIYGCCISRDIFGFAENDNSYELTGYKVNKYIFINSPLSLFSEPYQGFENVEFEDFGSTPNFTKRCCITDLKKTALKEYKETKSDYLLIDLDNVRFTLSKIINDKNEKIITRSHIFEWNKNKILNKSKLLLDNLENINPFDISDIKWRDCIHKLANFFLSIYKEENIILNEYYLNEYYLDYNNNLSKFNENANKINSLIKKCVKWFLEICPNCHIVKKPKYVLSDENHKWGLNSFHCTKEYYEYALKAIDIIIKKYDIQKENNLLDELKCEYSEIYENIFKDALDKSLKLNKSYLEKYIYNDKYTNKLISIQKNQKKPYLECLFDMYNKSYYTYQVEKKDCLNEYMKSIIEDKENVIFLSVKDDASYKWSFFTTDRLLGIKSSPKWREPYNAIIDLKKNLLLESNTQPICYLEYKISNLNLFNENIDEYTIDISNINCMLVSQGFDPNDKSSVSKILINNIDYSMNKRGLNIVVYNRNLKQVVDSFNVDIHADSELKINRYI